MNEPKKILIDTDVYERALPNYQGKVSEYISVNQLKEWIEGNTINHFPKTIIKNELLKYLNEV